MRRQNVNETKSQKDRPRQGSNLESLEETQPKSNAMPFRHAAFNDESEFISKYKPKQQSLSDLIAGLGAR